MWVTTRARLLPLMFANRKAPCSSVRVDAFLFLRLTVAPATGSPFSVTTLPLTTFCAKAGTTRNNKQETTKKALERLAVLFFIQKRVLMKNDIFTFSKID